MASRSIGWRCRLALLAVLIATAFTAGPVRAESAAAPPLTSAQIEQLVAPIALYPDSLMSQVLMAATYPLEVVEAARWAKDNPDVTGQALQDAMQKQSWDPSVKALTAVPQTLQMMNDKLDWTQQLGDAFLAQQADVLDAVQRLRTRADAAGNLQTTPQQKVAKVAAPSSGGGPVQTVYTIEPATPNQYYVPIYNPAVVFGTWPYPDYAPVYWYPPGFVGTGALSFAAGIGVGWALWGRVDWWNHRVNINVNRYNRFNHTNITNNTWIHNAAHRHGVPYRDRNVANRFADQKREAEREAGRRELQKQNEANREGERKGEAKREGKGEAKAKREGGGKEARKKDGGKREGAKREGGKREGGKREGAKKTERRKSAEHRPAQRREARHARASHGGGHRGGGRRR